jgi:hypothetical protein
MYVYPVFLSVVCVCRNQGDRLEPLLANISAQLAALVSDHELIVVDNASQDQSVAELRRLTGEAGLPNMQVYALTKEVDADTAAWVGVENALGDFVAVLDPLLDDAAFLPSMLERAVSGADVVFATNEQAPLPGLAYRVAFSVFNALYRRISGIHLAKEAPQYRVLSKQVINHMLQFAQPTLSYRHLPATAGFAKVNLSYSSPPTVGHSKHLGNSIDRGIKLLTLTTGAPMRLVTTLSLFGAVANVFYSFYVVAIALFKENVAEGWVSLSLQQSGMFFLISMVLLVLGEYILNMASASNGGPLYHVGQEFTSARITRREKLNVEETRTVASSAVASP